MYQYFRNSKKLVEIFSFYTVLIVLVYGYIEELSLSDCDDDDLNCNLKVCSSNFQIGEYHLSTQACKDKCDSPRSTETTLPECKFFSSYFVPLLNDMICTTYSSCSINEKSNIPHRNYGATYRKLTGTQMNIVELFRLSNPSNYIYMK